MNNEYFVLRTLFLSAIDDSSTDGFDGFVGVGKLFQINRFTDMHVNRYTMDEGFAFRQHLKAAVQRKRNDRQTQIPCDLERSAFELTYFAVQAACTFRENDGTNTVNQLFLHFLEALHRRFRTPAVYEDMSGCRIVES